jgi:hypothetical protein
MTDDQKDTAISIDAEFMAEISAQFKTLLESEAIFDEHETAAILKAVASKTDDSRQILKLVSPSTENKEQD